MGGVGKTTLVTHVHNKVLEKRRKFCHVFWVAVSQDFSIYRLQSLVAKAIQLDLGTEDDVMKRAAKLSKELNKRSKFVIILDDLWNHFDVRKVGIPIERNGCKLIVTTRSIEVCRRTNCQKLMKLRPLCEAEAWKLFVETIGYDLAQNVEKVAKSVARECAGLPLGIVTMAGSMRGVDDVHEWKNALTELQQSLVRHEDMEGEVFGILRYSFTRLNDSSLQHCLLYCALFPEDYEIEREKLIEYLIVEKIIDQERGTRHEKFNKGHAILNKLENVSLLERVGDNSVKMHDLIRDMAVQILKECLPSLIEPGKQLKEIPDERYWKDIARVSLMQNDLKKICPNQMSLCPNVSTLLVSKNEKLQFIAEYFFYHLQGLKVLDLSSTAIQRLPESVASLKQLTALFTHCCPLSYIPTLANLKLLELLDLYRCWAIKKVPEGLDFLSNLQYLNLFMTGIPEFPAGILPKLSRLQFLAFDGPSKTIYGAKAEELAGLTRLETLYWCFLTVGDSKTYLQLLAKRETKPVKYSLCVGLRHLEEVLDKAGLGQELIIKSYTLAREMTEIHLAFWGWLVSDEESSFGIYGMGGVGKTTFVKHVYNKLLGYPHIFRHVFWVTVPPDFSIYRLQSLVAKAIQLDLGTEDDVMKRAAKLSKELNKRSNFVIILDDLWNHFDVRKVGIPIERNGCKLIVTTRSIEVCRRTNCQKLMKLEWPLREAEAWELFVGKLGYDHPEFL